MHAWVFRTLIEPRVECLAIQNLSPPGVGIKRGERDGSSSRPKLGVVIADDNREALAERAAIMGRRDLQGPMIEMNGAPAVDDPRVMRTQDPIQVGLGQRHRAVRILGTARRFGEALIVREQEGLQQRVSRSEGTDTGQAQCLDETILKGLVYTLHAAFGRR